MEVEPDLPGLAAVGTAAWAMMLIRSGWCGTGHPIVWFSIWVRVVGVPSNDRHVIGKRLPVLAGRWF